MPCLVCGKRIPLLQQLSRSQFCSATHEEEHTALQQKQIIARLTPTPRFTIRGPVGLTVDLQEWVGHAPERDDVPIQKFQDPVLSRQFQRIRTGVKCAQTISAFPRESPPGAALAIGVSTPRNRVEQRLLASNRATLRVPRRLPAASLAGVSAQISDSSRTIRRSVADFQDLQGVRRLRIGLSRNLPSPAGWRALEDAFPVEFETPAPAPRPESGPVAGFRLRIALNGVPSRSAYAGGACALARPYRRDWFAPFDSAPGQPCGRRFEPHLFPLRLELFTLGKLLAPPGLRALQVALPVGLETPSASGRSGESFAPFDSTPRRPPGQCFEPYPFSVIRRLFTLGELPAPAGLRALQDALPVGLDTLASASPRSGESFAPFDSAPGQSPGRRFEPYSFPVIQRLFTLESLPAPAGLRALQNALPVWLDALAPASRPAVGPPLGFSFRIALNGVPPNRANGCRGNSLGTHYCGESFEPVDSEPNPLRGRGFELLRPRLFPARLERFTVEGGRAAANADDGYFRQMILSERPGPGAAGFALEELDPPVAHGFSEPLFLSCDFPLCPVWLPALFDKMGGLIARLRRCVKPAQIFPPLSACEGLLPADGPGFSGSLACPTAGAAIWDRKADKSEEVAAPKPVSQPAPPARTAPTAPPTPPVRPEASWQRVLRFWRQTPKLVRCTALAIPLTVSTLLYAPSISLSSTSASTLTGSWEPAIKARATVDLRDEFDQGFKAWSGKPGWQKNWAINGSGSAQPGQLALFTPSIPLTSYRFEFQGQILSKALGMALRAADTNNYQAVKLVVSKPSGGLSTLTLRRYAVIEGREGPKSENAIPLTVRNDTLYKVLVNVQDDHFQVTVNGVFADAWSDDRFKSGGIGFFAEKGEVAHVRTVHVIDKEDFLGWLCYQVSQWTADRPTIGDKHE